MGIDVSRLSPSNQDYLKALFNLAEWRSAPVTAKVLAEHVGVRLSSASDAVRRLEKKGLVEHAPYGAIALSELGREYALAMVRRHRLIETFLVESLGYRWDQVHDEAENLEHCVSDFLIDRIDAQLGRPARDPHGDPIPTAAGDYPAGAGDLDPLAALNPGEESTVARVHDADPQLLQHFSDHGLVIGARVRVGEPAPYSGSVPVDIRGESGSATLSLGPDALGAVWVRSSGRAALRNS